MKKILIPAILFFLCASQFQLRAHAPSLDGLGVYEADVEMDLKEEAFRILEMKCNSCHRKDKPKWVFTLDNMESSAKKIHKQVFVNGKMPKGDIIKLTDSEKTILKNWLQTALPK